MGIRHAKAQEKIDRKIKKEKEKEKDQRERERGSLCQEIFYIEKYKSKHCMYKSMRMH